MRFDWLPEWLGKGWMKVMGFGRERLVGWLVHVGLLPIFALFDLTCIERLSRAHHSGIVAYKIVIQIMPSA